MKRAQIAGLCAALLFHSAFTLGHQLSCGGGVLYQQLSGLPEFTQSESTLDQYHCRLTGRITGYKGNWFPALPSIHYAQGSNGTAISSGTGNTTRQSISGIIPIKRLGRSTFSIVGNRNDHDQLVMANEDINFRQPNGTDLVLADQQKLVLNRTHTRIGRIAVSHTRSVPSHGSHHQPKYA